MAWNIRTLVNSVELGNQWIQNAGTVVYISDSEYAKLTAASFGVATTVSASTSAGATTITTAVTTTVGTVINIDTGGLFETATVSAVSGSGPYSLTVPALKYAHASGVAAVFGGTLGLVGQVVNTADGVSTQAALVSNAAALTAPSTFNTTWTSTEANSLRADVLALQTKINAILAALQGTGKPMSST